MVNQQLSLDTIFCTAIEIASVEDRAGYLAEACGIDLNLRQRVERTGRRTFSGRRFSRTIDGQGWHHCRPTG